MMRHFSSLFLSVSLCAAAAVRTPQCSDLQGLRAHMGIRDNEQFNATTVATHSLQIEGKAYNNTLPLCRVSGSIKYGCSGNNTLLFEVWLPDTAHYNGRYISVGNGGYAGQIDYVSMLSNLNNGFAVGGCDSGHPVSQNGKNEPGSFVQFFNDRDATLAWIHDSIAMFTDPAKKLAKAYYSHKPRMYYAGCSTGGAQGFALAQFHPDVFEGIYAGSPGNYYSHLMLSFLWNGLNSNKSGAFLSQDALTFITTAVIAKCDAIDGRKDGVIDDPTKCDFDINTLQCADGQESLSGNKTVCLTSTQVDNAKKFYAGPKDARNGKQLYPGFALGSEIEWLLQETSLYLQYAVLLIQNLAFKDLSFDYTKFNWASDVDVLDQNASPLIDEISPDLTEFKKNGGKIIVTQGWADPFNAPFWPIQQRDEMYQKFGDSLKEFYSLFMIPAGGHCGPAAGYDQVPGVYHYLDALIPWVEEGKVPQTMLITDPPDKSGTNRTLEAYM